MFRPAIFATLKDMVIVMMMAAVKKVPKKTMNREYQSNLFVSSVLKSTFFSFFASASSMPLFGGLSLLHSF